MLLDTGKVPGNHEVLEFLMKYAELEIGESTRGTWKSQKQLPNGEFVLTEWFKKAVFARKLTGKGRLKVTTSARRAEVDTKPKAAFPFAKTKGTYGNSKFFVVEGDYLVCTFPLLVPLNNNHKYHSKNQ